MAEVKIDILYKKDAVKTPLMDDLILPSSWSVMQNEGGVNVTGNDIQDDTITAGNIEGLTITASEIAAATITATQIANATITGAQIASTTIEAVNIANATITATEIANATITGTQIASTTIAASNIVNSTITATQIASSTITANEIANATITATEIANSTITATQIANATITTTQISGTAAITGGQIANATIIGGNIGATTIAAGNIVNGTITTTQISGSANITGGQIANATIVGSNISNTAGIVGGQIDNLTITAGNIANLTITTSQIANATIVGGDIAQNTITGGAAGNIALTSITAVNIAATTITANEIAVHTITASQIAANTITGSEILTMNLTAKTLTADTGTVGGFALGSTYIRDVANSFGLASVVTAGDDVRFWAGDTFANRATAPFNITEAGHARVNVLTNKSILFENTTDPGAVDGQMWTANNAANKKVLWGYFGGDTSNKQQISMSKMAERQVYENDNTSGGSTQTYDLVISTWFQPRAVEAKGFISNAAGDTLAITYGSAQNGNDGANTGMSIEISALTHNMSNPTFTYQDLVTTNGGFNLIANPKIPLTIDASGHVISYYNETGRQIISEVTGDWGSMSTPYISNFTDSTIGSVDVMIAWYEANCVISHNGGANRANLNAYAYVLTWTDTSVTIRIVCKVGWKMAGIYHVIG